MPSSWGGDAPSPPGPRRKGGHRGKRKGCGKAAAAALLVMIAIIGGFAVATWAYLVTVIY